MGDNCQVNSNIYMFSISEISGLVCCGQPPSQPFVVGNRPMGRAVLRVQKQDGPPDCTYVISWGPGNYVQNVDTNVFIVTDPETPSEWIITPRGNDQYTIVLKDTTLAWTDPGGSGGCERQLHLTELDPIRPEVLFKIGSAPGSAEPGTVTVVFTANKMARS